MMVILVVRGFAGPHHTVAVAVVDNDGDFRLVAFTITMATGPERHMGSRKSSKQHLSLGLGGAMPSGFKLLSLSGSLFWADEMGEGWKFGESRDSVAL